ncbi:hypothetical protein HOLleu_02669 [Holothuria leucospilota]|uniref:Uncharacterized protein n=1 Tax=Holothuria leucospilota TaxID=206669 RepID=A0A9Q1CPX9_HOLLE|nr:hypothetical protein HOLleu_02669 [Holothuria leucospilota]
MATPSGPCLPSWNLSPSAALRLYGVKKRKPSEQQAYHCPVKRRCSFPAAEVLNLTDNWNPDLGRNLQDSESIVKTDLYVPTLCGHDSLLHNADSEAEHFCHTAGSPCLQGTHVCKVTSASPQDHVDERMDLDVVNKSIDHVSPKSHCFENSNVKTGGDSLDAGSEASKASLREKAEKLASTLQFMKDHNITSNDYWAVPPESELSMEEELEMARVAMETDYAPNPDQYRSHSSNSTSRTDKVRVFCKPYWDESLHDQSHFF